jgi:hypothetical protein
MEDDKEILGACARLRLLIGTCEFAFIASICNKIATEPKSFSAESVIDYATRAALLVDRN